MFTRRDSHQSKSSTETPPKPETRPPAARVEVAPRAPELLAPTTPVAAPPQVAAPAVGSQSMSVVASGDTIEGKLLTTNGVRVLGTVRGTIESKSNIQVEADALVEADITAENVTIAGTYKGNLNCSGRLEITSTGRASGELETGRILLHEGGFFEGTLHMKPPEQQAAPEAAPPEGNRRRYGSST